MFSKMVCDRLYHDDASSIESSPEKSEESCRSPGACWKSVRRSRLRADAVDCADGNLQKLWDQLIRVQCTPKDAPSPVSSRSALSERGP